MLDLQEGILELFSEAQEKSRYKFTYKERDHFIITKQLRGGIYTCGFCRSQNPAHNCPIENKKPVFVVNYRPISPSRNVVWKPTIQDFKRRL